MDYDSNKFCNRRKAHIKGDEQDAEFVLLEDKEIVSVLELQSF